MHCNPYDSYDLFEHMNTHLTRQVPSFPRNPSFYPSEASVRAVDEHGDPVVYGGCLRKSFMRLSPEYSPTPHSANTQILFSQGNRVESYLVDIWKEMGIWVANNVKFVNTPLRVSGEIDAILREPDGTEYLVEVKSFSGYNAEKQIMGNKSQRGFPKWGQLLQTLVYLSQFQDRFPYARMVYFDRAMSKRRTFKIELLKEGNVTYPVVDGDVIRTFTIEDMLSRYEDLARYVDGDVLPPRDFELQFPDHRIEDYFAKGKVGKTKYALWQKGRLKPGEHIGNWECSYCGFKDLCWKD